MGGVKYFSDDYGEFKGKMIANGQPVKIATNV